MPSSSNRQPVNEEAGLLGRELVQDSARLAEVERVEVVTVDVARVRHAGLPNELDPARQVGVVGAPRDVVHDARALAAALGGRRVERDPAAAPVAAQLEPILVADAASAHQLLEHLRRSGGVGAVGADALEAAQRELGGNLGVHGDQRRVVGGVGDQLVREALGVGEPKAGRIALERDALCGRAGPAQKSSASSEPTRWTMRCTMPAPGRPGFAPGYSKNVRSAPGRACSSP